MIHTATQRCNTNTNSNTKLHYATAAGEATQHNTAQVVGQGITARHRRNSTAQHIQASRGSFLQQSGGRTARTPGGTLRGERREGEEEGMEERREVRVKGDDEEGCWRREIKRKKGERETREGLD